METGLCDSIKNMALGTPPDKKKIFCLTHLPSLYIERSALSMVENFS